MGLMQQLKVGDAMNVDVLPLQCTLGRVGRSCYHNRNVHQIHTHLLKIPINGHHAHE